VDEDSHFGNAKSRVASAFVVPSVERRDGWSSQLVMMHGPSSSCHAAFSICLERTDRNVISVRIPEEELLGLSVRIRA
jgi:hypothetical protein